MVPRGFALSLLSLTLLAGCPRPVGGSDGGGGADSGYVPGPGNPFTGAISLDDARVSALDPAVLRAGDTPCREPALVRVYRIIDGDTVMVRGEGAVVIDVSVRMIGVDTPEVAHPGVPAECYSAESTDFTRQLDGRLVYLTFDGDCFDQFDRLLAYVHVGAGEGDLWQRQILRRGLGRTLTIGDNRTYASLLDADEQSALSSNTGIWGECF